MSGPAPKIQEPQAADSAAWAYPHKQFSTSITTGQEGSGNQHWTRMKSKTPGTYRSLGNNRAPIPTCGIAIRNKTPNVMTVDGEEAQPWSDTAKLSDIILGQPGGEPHSSEHTRAHSHSMESTRDVAVVNPAFEHGSHANAEQSDFCSEDHDLLEHATAEPGHNPHHSAKQAAKASYRRKSKDRKSVGRPLAYEGDPDAPELTDHERRRIKRRIANRESARRVRHKRLEVLEDMQIKMEQLNAHNYHLEHRAEEVEEQRANLVGQLKALQGEHSKTVDENRLMQEEIKALRQSLQVKMNALEDELDKRAQEVEQPELLTAFAGPMRQPPSSTNLLEAEPSLDLSKAPLEWLPSLNIDDIHQKSDAWEILNNFCLEGPPNGAQLPVQ